MDCKGLSYIALTAQSKFEVRFFDRGPIPYSQVIQLFTGTMPAPLRHWNKNTHKQPNWCAIPIWEQRIWWGGWSNRPRRSPAMAGLYGGPLATNRAPEFGL